MQHNFKLTLITYYNFVIKINVNVEKGKREKFVIENKIYFNETENIKIIFKKKGFFDKEPRQVKCSGENGLDKFEY